MPLAAQIINIDEEADAATILAQQSNENNNPDLVDDNKLDAKAIESPARQNQ